jgi:hypothetical protein
VTTTPDDLEGGVGQQLSKVPMEEGELLGTELIWWKEPKEPLSKVIWIGADSMREHADAPILAVSFGLYKRSADSISGCTTHEAGKYACRWLRVFHVTSPFPHSSQEPLAHHAPSPRR